MQINTVELSAEDEIRFFDPEKYKNTTGLFDPPPSENNMNAHGIGNREPNIHIHPKSQLGHHICCIYPWSLLNGKKNRVWLVWTSFLGTMQRNQQNGGHESDL